jgi:hypothetical protein
MTSYITNERITETVEDEEKLREYFFYNVNHPDIVSYYAQTVGINIPVCQELLDALVYIGQKYSI